MKNSCFNKLWVKLFLRLAAVFLVFVLIIMISNSTLLTGYFIKSQKSQLLLQKSTVQHIDINNSDTTIDTLTSLEENKNIETEIYSSDGTTLYTTYGGQMLDFLYGPYKNSKFKMQHRELDVIESNKLMDGTVLEISKDKRSNNEYIVYRIEKDTYTVEMRVQMQMLKTSAQFANKFIKVIAIICLAGAMIWVFVFAKRTAKPITEMNSITKDMANLNFSRKIKIKEKETDEIGELANSINLLSEKLDATLSDLRSKNEKLKDEIETERSLDIMRKEFVANVSHELKTPIAIIRGYAEGLKEVDTSKKEEYCNIIIDESSRMNKLVLSILNLSKFESKSLQPNCTKFNIGEMCENLAKRIIVKNKLILKTESTKNVDVFADPDLYEQAIKSYLENAESHAEGEVTVETTVKGDKVFVNVSNVGEQIDEKEMPYIWQSFYRGDTSHKRDKTRFGLGLSICSAIAKLHNESLGVYNTKTGVTFWISVAKAD